MRSPSMYLSWMLFLRLTANDLLRNRIHRWGTKSVRINQVYQEYIADKNHLHMNATRWLSLTEFTKHLGRTAICRVEENEEKGWYVEWIDNSPKALAKAESNQKKERGDMDDESRQRKLIQEQIERARKEGIKRRVEREGGTFDEATFEENGGNESLSADAVGADAAPSNELIRTEEKVSLSLSFKIQPSTSAAASSSAALPATTSTSASPPSTAPFSTVITPTDSNATSSLPVASTSALPTASLFSNPIKSVPAVVKPAFNAFKSNPLSKSNPLKRSNPLKASSTSASSSSSGPQKRVLPGASNVEKIIQEEMARKARMTPGGYGSNSSSTDIDWDKERGTKGVREREEQEKKRMKYSFRG